MPATTACLVCGRPEPLGLAVCPACGGAAPGVADRLVFVLPPRGRGRRRDLRQRLAELTGRPARSEAVDAASRGLRALARIPHAAAAEVVARLDDAGIRAHAARADRAWAAVPLSFAFLLAAAAGAGMLAGLHGPRILLVLTPVFVSLVAWSAMRGVRRPLYPDVATRGAPPALVGALTELPRGQARDIVAELTQATREVCSTEARLGLPASLVRILDDLLPVAARAAADLASLDQTIADFEARGRGADPLPEGWATSLDELRRTRARLVGYLLEVTALVGRLQGLSADGLSSAGERLRELRTSLTIAD